MKKIIGIIKFVTSFVLVAAFLTSFTITAMKYDILISVIVIGMLSTLGGIHIAYLIRTGLWNVKDAFYKIKLLPLLGLLLQFVYGLILLYYRNIFKETFFSTILLALAGFCFGLYDLRQFYKSWKRDKMEIIEF